MHSDIVILWTYLILAGMLAIIAVVLNALKFSLLIETCVDKRLSRILWVKVFAQSSLLNNVIPHGGTAYRAKFLKEYAAISYTEFVGLAYLFAFMGLICLLTLVGILFLLYFSSHYFLLITLAVLAIIVVAILLLRNVSKFSLGYSRLDFYLQKLAIVWILLAKSFKSGNLLRVVGLFFLSSGVDFAVFLSTCYAFNVHTNMLAVLLLYTTLSLAWLIRFTPGNIGIQEFLMGFSSKIIGSGFIVGVSLSIFSRFIYILANSFIWVFLRFLVKS